VLTKAIEKIRELRKNARKICEVFFKVWFEPVLLNGNVFIQELKSGQPN
jgi:hypothetical protein